MECSVAERLLHPWSWEILAHCAPIDADDLSRDIRCRGRNEPSGHGSHVLRRAPATQRRLTPDAPPASSRKPSAPTPFGSIPAPDDSPELPGRATAPAFAEGHDGALARGKKLAAVSFHAGLRLVPAHVEQHTVAARFHPLSDFTGEEHRGRDIQGQQFAQLTRERPMPGFSGERIGASIVDPNIQAPRFIPGSAHQAAGILLLRKSAKMIRPRLPRARS